MLRRMISKHNQIMIGISVFCLLVTLGCCLLVSFLRKEKAAGPVLVEELVGDCYFFSDKETLSSDLFSAQEEIRLVYGRNKNGVYETEDGVRYVEKTEKTISGSFPVFQKNGATVYLPETAYEHRFICSDFSLREAEVAWISYGAAFLMNNSRAFSEDVFLIDFYDGIYMNTIPFMIEDYVKTEVSVNSFVSFLEKEIVVLEFSDGVLQRNRIEASGQTMITMGDRKVSYYNLRKFLKDAYETEQPMLQNGFVLEGDYYYYFLSERYEINGPCYLYETKDGFYLENEEKAFLLPDCPLYEKGTDRILLPRDYMMLQMTHHLFYCLPELSDIKLAEEAVYVSVGDSVSSFKEIMLHDGEEHYVVLNEATLRMGELELIVSPLSCIYITDEMELCFYQYDSEELLSFATGGTDAELILANGDVVYLYDRMMRRKDGALDLLQKDPSVFQTVQ